MSSKKCQQQQQLAASVKTEKQIDSSSFSSSTPSSSSSSSPINSSSIFGNKQTISSNFGQNNNYLLEQLRLYYSQQQLIKQQNGNLFSSINSSPFWNQQTTSSFPFQFSAALASFSPLNYNNFLQSALVESINGKSQIDTKSPTKSEEECQNNATNGKPKNITSSFFDHLWQKTTNQSHSTPDTTNALKAIILQQQLATAAQQWLFSGNLMKNETENNVKNNWIGENKNVEEKKINNFQKNSTTFKEIKQQTQKTNEIDKELNNNLNLFSELNEDLINSNNSSSVDSIELDEWRHSSAAGSVLRSRSFLSDQQLRILAEQFRRNSLPSKYELSSLAEKINVNKRVVQVWFQNMRAKAKRANRLSAISDRLSRNAMRNAKQQQQQNKQKINNLNDLKIEKELNNEEEINKNNFKLNPIDPALLQKLVNNVINGAKKKLNEENSKQIIEEESPLDLSFKKEELPDIEHNNDAFEGNHQEFKKDEIPEIIKNIGNKRRRKLSFGYEAKREKCGNDEEFNKNFGLFETSSIQNEIKIKREPEENKNIHSPTLFSPNCFLTTRSDLSISPSSSSFSHCCSGSASSSPIINNHFITNDNSSIKSTSSIWPTNNGKTTPSSISSTLLSIIGNGQKNILNEWQRVLEVVIAQQPDPQAFWFKPVAVGSDNYMPLKDVTGIDFANLFGGIGGGRKSKIIKNF
uniref:Homeobox domain-containing protein n=1 Tax=Meloidogyne hapla TaxID=6305 RepID=A0A1I8BHP5_MELHA